MDGQRFDEITKALAAGASRRRIIQGIAAGALGAAFGLRRAAPGDAAGPCRQLGEACKPGPTGIELGSCCATNANGGASNLFCQKVAETGADRCECTTGFVRCNGACVSISCPGGASLNTTTCTCECPDSAPLCNGACVPNTCPAGSGQVFNTSTCACECPSTAPEACGGVCLAPCPSGQVRNATTCACECGPNTVLCNGACVSDACPAGSGQVFNTTSCSCVCPASTPDSCGGICRSACAVGLTRNPSTCACECPSGTVSCTPPGSTTATCASTTCSGGQVFDPATCTCACAPDEVFCGGLCHNPETTCAGLHNKIFNVECCNQGANPCQNPGQPSGRCKA